jgi:hypothetical protein
MIIFRPVFWVILIVGCATGAFGFVQSYRSRRLYDERGDRIGVELMLGGGIFAMVAAIALAKPRTK